MELKLKPAEKREEEREGELSGANRAEPKEKKVLSPERSRVSQVMRVH